MIYIYHIIHDKYHSMKCTHLPISTSTGSWVLLAPRCQSKDQAPSDTSSQMHAPGLAGLLDSLFTYFHLFRVFPSNKSPCLSREAIHQNAASSKALFQAQALLSVLILIIDCTFSIQAKKMCRASWVLIWISVSSRLKQSDGKHWHEF